MGAYILRRLLLILPTLFGIMVINFTLTQFVPGGPIEQIIAEVQGEGDSLAGLTGAGADVAASEAASDYEGAQGLPQDFLDELEVQFGFARLVCEEGFTGRPDVEAEECTKEPIPALERFGIMMGNYLTLDFGESYFRNIGVFELVAEKMPVSISLGLWTTLLAYIISIPLGVAKAVRDGTPFDTWTSGAVIIGYAIPGFLFALMLILLFAGGSYWQIFPLRGIVSEGWSELPWGARILDYLWHMVLPVAALSISGFASLTLLTKNSFLDEIKKQYVITARAKGLSERQVLYGHVFRNGMLIVIAGFPGAFLSVFFTGSLLIELLFSLDGLGRLGFEAAVERDYPVIFGTLFVFGLIGLAVNIITDITYVLVDPRIDFERRAG